MHEEFLHFIWKTRRFASQDLRTTQGQTVSVLQPGVHNAQAGPDFLEARIAIDRTLWVGQVEMHLRSSDWMRHGHGDDRAYDNVILHVVLEADTPIVRSDGSRLPCLELRSRIPARLLGRYKQLQGESGWIPCQPQWPDPDPLRIVAWLDRLLVERLEARLARLHHRLTHWRGDWEQTFYQQLARGFGARVHAEAFEQLAERLPLRLLHKHRDNLVQLEALIFGQAGLLQESYKDAHPRLLQREFDHMRRKYGLTPMSGVQWKFLRMRPNNFPTLRLAQFALLHHQTHALFAKVLAAQNLAEIENMFELRLANYWKDHLRFDRQTRPRNKRLGKQAIHLIAINAVAPMLFFFGREHGQVALERRALQLLEEIPPENNRHTRAWKKLGLTFRSAAQTQAVLQWKAHYCDRRRCLECAIGQMLLR